MPILEIIDATLFGDILYLLGYVSLLAMPLVAAAILVLFAPKFGARQFDFGYAMNAGIYGILGLIPPAILLYMVPFFIELEDRAFTVNFYSVCTLLLHLLTLYISISIFHRLPRNGTLALTGLVFAGCWLNVFVFAALPKLALIFLFV